MNKNRTTKMSCTTFLTTILVLLTLLTSCSNVVDDADKDKPISPECAPNCQIADDCIAHANCQGDFLCVNKMCAVARCGDNIVSGVEECDNGINIGSYGGCNSNCTLAAYCGDGVIDINPGDNLVVNGDFAGANLSGWTPIVVDTTLQEQIVVVPSYLSPPLIGNAFRIRPGNQVVDGGRSQEIDVVPGKLYRWSIDVGMDQVQGTIDSDAGTTETFMLRLNGNSVWTVTHSDKESPTTDSGTGIFTPTSTPLKLELIFNRDVHGFTHHPQWFADNVFFGEISEECDNGVNNGSSCNANCTLPLSSIK